MYNGKKANGIIAYFFFVIVYKALLDWSYSRVMSVAFGYMGFAHNFSLGYSLASWFVVFCFSVLSYSCYRNHEGRVSNEILYILFLISVVPFTSMMAYGQFSGAFIVCCLIYWLSFFLFHRLFLRKKGKKKITFLKSRRIVGEQAVVMITLVLCLVVVYVSGRYAHFRFNFNLNDVYDIRYEARGYNLPKPLEYLYSWSKVCIAVFLAYFIRRKKWLYVAICIIVQMLSFGIEGSKFVFFLTICVVVIGFLPSLNLTNINKWIIIGVCGFIALGAALYLIAGNTMIFYMFVRRVMFLPLRLEECYYDFFTKNVPDYFRGSFLRYLGFSTPYPALSRIIGNLYFGAPNMNANNGLLSDAFANLGYSGIILMPLLITYVLDILDNSAQGLDARIYISTSLYIALSLTNSFFFTVLLTHGLLVVIVILALMKRESPQSEMKNA